MSGAAPSVVKGARGLQGVFQCMASPWEVHVAGAGEDELARVTAAVCAEVRRIEQKYSRYRDDSVVQRINASTAPVEVDEETARLIHYAAALWKASEGAFDITTGVLRRVWKFDRSDRLPSVAQVSEIRELVGWHRLEWNGRSICLQPGMEIDLGGIGKEYAVDRAAGIAAQLVGKPILINGGGDLFATAPPAAGQAWHVGIEGSDGAPTIKLQQGGLATSGDAHRYLLKDGVRYSHVLDPRTGWPVADAPRSATVLAPTCSEAGSYATLALLAGKGAETYLTNLGVDYWLNR